MHTQYTELIEKQKTLVAAANALKQEFVGLDGVIDEVTESVSSWYLFPHMQERPVVINLWGLTGVGKSSLVQRLAQLLGYEEKFFHFDLGEDNAGAGSLKNAMEELFNHANGYPVILALDEFQHARTRNDMGVDEERNATRVVWQLLDSGKFQFSENDYYVGRLHKIIKKMLYLLGKGVEVSGGYVVKKQEYFLSIMNDHREYEDYFGNKTREEVTDLMFFPAKQLDDLMELSRGEFLCVQEVRDKLLSLNGPETIAFLMEIFTIGNSPKIADCSKSLIFVLGNLDEVYSMSSDFNPDRDADEFYLQSLKINVPCIKKALKKKFRSEQIARLGNNHIIYPALSRKSYEEIIYKELDKLAQRVKENHGVQLHSDSSLMDLLYKEGVYPSQGTRPVFSTIHQLVSSKLGRILSEMVLKNLHVTHIQLRAETAGLSVGYMSENTLLHTLVMPHKLTLEKLREDRCDDMQAIAAVHESGHAVLSAVLLKTIPEVIFSNSAYAGIGGWVFSKLKWKYVSRKEIIPRLAVFLGGFAAEKVIFGEENVTTGAQEDIGRATEFAAEMLKSCGMGELPGAFHAEAPETRAYLVDTSYSINTNAREWLEQAMQLAEDALREQEPLLLHMAGYLSDHRRLKKEQIRQMVEQYVRNFDTSTLVENGDLLFYRHHLKAKLENQNRREAPSGFAKEASGLVQSAQLNYGEK